MATGEFEGIERRIDHPDVGALCLGLHERLAVTGDAHGIPKGREDHARFLGDLDAFIHPAIGSTQTGQPGPWMNSTPS